MEKTTYFIEVNNQKTFEKGNYKGKYIRIEKPLENDSLLSIIAVGVDVFHKQIYDLLIERVEFIDFNTQEFDVIDAGYIKSNLQEQLQITIYRESQHFPNACELEDRKKTAEILQQIFDCKIHIGD